MKENEERGQQRCTEQSEASSEEDEINRCEIIMKFRKGNQRAERAKHGPEEAGDGSEDPAQSEGEEATQGRSTPEDSNQLSTKYHRKCVFRSTDCEEEEEGTKEEFRSKEEEGHKTRRGQ